MYTASLTLYSTGAERRAVSDRWYHRSKLMIILYIILYDVLYLVVLLLHWTVSNLKLRLQVSIGSCNWTTTDNIVDNGDDSDATNEGRCRAITDAMMCLDW